MALREPRPVQPKVSSLASVGNAPTEAIPPVSQAVSTPAPQAQQREPSNRPTVPSKPPAPKSAPLAVEATLVEFLREHGPRAIATALAVDEGNEMVSIYLNSAEGYLRNTNGQNYSKLLTATPESIVAQVAKLAALKLLLNEDQGTAFLTTRSVKCRDREGYVIVAVGQPGIRGMEKILREEGVLTNQNSNAVRRQDTYQPTEGTAGVRNIVFRRNSQPDFSKPNDVIAAYAVLTGANAQEIVVTKTVREPEVANKENLQIIMQEMRAANKTAITERDEENMRARATEQLDQMKKARPPIKTPLEKMGVGIINPGYMGVVKAAEYSALREALRIAGRIWSKNEKLKEILEGNERGGKIQPAVAAEEEEQGISVA